MLQAELLQALDLLRDGELRPGDAHEGAHRICQAHEGTALFDWVHALVHRIEGDDANAAYWYRRAGRSRHPGTLEDEWQAIRRTAES